MSKLIVGCGYLGLRAARRWLDQGAEVYASTRSEGRVEELRSLGIRPIQCDVLQPASLQQFPQAATVLYCVGLDRAAGFSMRQVYVEGLGHVLDHLPTPEKLIYVSSTSVYGQTGGEEVDENAATEPLDESGRVVLEAERLLRERVPGSILLRFAGIYGPERLLRQQALLSGQPLATDPDKWLNLIHVEDGAAAVLGAEQRGCPGEIYNICDGHPVQRRDFYAHLARLLNAPPPRFVEKGSDAPPAARDLANRRIGNRKMLQELEGKLTFPSYREGLNQIAAATR